MFFPSSKPQAQRGFTLIELLTVMAIIAILMGLLFPATSYVMNSARKTQAASDEQRIVSAVMAYKADYGRLPINHGQQGGATSLNANGPQDTVDGDPHGTYPNVYLFNILRGIADTLSTGDGYGNNPNNVVNPRQVVYFQAPNVKNASQPRSGFLLSQYKTPGTTGNPSYTIPVGSLVDPWGNEYMIFLDATGDNDISGMFTQIYTAYPPYQGPSGAVQVVSMGPDSTLGKNGSLTPVGSDDVISW